MEAVARRRLVRWLPVVGYMALVTYLSSRTPDGLPTFDFIPLDKVLHVIEYAGLGFLVCRAIAPVQPVARRLFFAIAWCIVFGLVDEWHQTFVPGRQGNDPGDLTADAIGGAIGAVSQVVFARAWGRIRVKP